MRKKYSHFVDRESRPRCQGTSKHALGAALFSEAGGWAGEVTQSRLWSLLLLVRRQMVSNDVYGDCWCERAPLTRLETRTKESNIYASMLVQKPSCVINVIDAKLPAASTDHVPLDKGLSMSISVRTRKMVNYA